MDPSEPFATPVRQMLPFLLWAAVGLVVAFVILALVRLWGLRTQQRGGRCGGIDLDHLRRQLRAGDISQEEYEAVRNTVAGAGGGNADPRPADLDAEPNDEPPSESDEADTPDTNDDPSERSGADGET